MAVFYFYTWTLHIFAFCAKIQSVFLVTKLCLTLCDPMDCSLPGSSVHGIFQARILEWLAISFSRGSSWPRDRTHISCITGRFFITEPPGKPIDRVYDTEFLPFTQKSWLLEVWSKQNLHLYQVNIQLWIEVNILPYYSDRWLSGKHPTCQCRSHRRHRFDPWIRKIPWRKAWQPTPVFLPGESLWPEEPGGLQSMGSQSDMTEWLSTHVAAWTIIWKKKHKNGKYSMELQILYQFSKFF